MGGSVMECWGVLWSVLVGHLKSKKVKKSKKKSKTGGPKRAVQNGWSKTGGPKRAVQNGRSKTRPTKKWGYSNFHQVYPEISEFISILGSPSFCASTVPQMRRLRPIGCLCLILRHI